MAACPISGDVPDQPQRRRVVGWTGAEIPAGRTIMTESLESVKGRMSDKLEKALSPVSLEVIDESAQHAGHMLHPGGVEPRGETHFRIKVVSEAFSGKSRLQRHRMINTELADELASGVHALAIEARAPGEPTRP